MPLREVLAKAAVERIGAGRLNRCEPWHLRNPSGVARFDERFTERAGVAEVSGGDDDPVGRVPFQILKQLPHDRLLPFDAKRIDRIHKVDAEFLRRFENESHRGIEVPAHLQAERAVRERLREFSGGHFSRRDEDNRPEPGLRGVGGGRRAGVAGRGAGDGACPFADGLRDGDGHPAIFE